MGSTVGAGMGLIFGTVTGFRSANGFLRTVRNSTFTSAATFGFFMGIGSLIRCDGNGGSHQRR